MEHPKLSVPLLLYAVVYISCFISGTNAEAEENVIVTTNLGKIRGTNLTSRLGEKFYAFRGIRYAQPPVGELRFKDPVPVDHWNGIFDATEDGPMCPQGFQNLSDMSEDCLRLNVYTKQLPIQQQNSESNTKKPVLVYFHPGGFYSVSGQSKNFAGPQLLMDRDIVLVTFNYRLSSLGFLATGTSEAPGNAALKDQVQVLRWVQEHISRFGGNPDSVTLIGYSAGGMSITLHMVSPMSKNLFHKAIIMSGSAIAQWKIPSEQIELAKKQANLKSMMDYTQTIGDMFEFGEGNPIILWSPVIEPDFGQERFLIEDPMKSFQDGNFMKIPVIAGITKDEFVGAAIGVLKDEALRQQMDTEFNKISPICFLYERDTPSSNNISHELRKVFLGNLPLDKTNSIEGLGFLFSDGVIGFGMHRFVRLAARYTKVFNYRFSYQGRFSHLYYPEEDKPYGVVHHDDLLYLFAVPSRSPLFPNTDPDHPTIERLSRMWTEFAKNGDPNKPNDEYLRGVRWRPFSFRREPYLDIGEELVMKEGLYTERFAVWKRLFPLSWTPKRNRGMIPNGDDFSEDYPLDMDHDYDHDHIHDHDHNHIHDHNCQHNKTK